MAWAEANHCTACRYRASAIAIPDVKYATFVLLLEYLYTDDVQITIDTAMELFQVADRFGIDRLKNLCEQEMLRAIDIETAAHILFTADQHSAEVNTRLGLGCLAKLFWTDACCCQNLRERCMNFVLVHFDEVSRTRGFEDMGRINVELSKSTSPLTSDVLVVTCCCAGATSTG